MNKHKTKEIIDYINQLQNEVENGTDSIEVCFWNGTNTIKEMLQSLDHAINCVGAIEQIKWERDIAISQLHELGLELGQKTDEVQRAIQHFNNLKKIAKGSDEEC